MLKAYKLRHNSQYFISVLIDDSIALPKPIKGMIKNRRLAKGIK